MGATSRIRITIGDPAGIGSEIIVKATVDVSADTELVVIGDAAVMRDAVVICDTPIAIHAVESIEESVFDDGTIDVLDLDNVKQIEYGTVKSDYGRASLVYVEQAIELAQRGAINAMVTAPINKQATYLAGSEHAGHTELLTDRTETVDYSMMLINDDLRVTHVSTHVPLREACALVTTETVRSVIRLTDDALRGLGIESPSIAVAGLNPHASDGGLFGEEEETEIAPTIEHVRSEDIDVSGPESSDTVYVRAARGEFDCVVSMYHDQRHIPIKLLGFQDDATGAVSGVNMTIGLPIIRTSVDHGTAFDIAGKGVALAVSMRDAVSVAARVAANRRSQ